VSCSNFAKTILFNEFIKRNLFQIKNGEDEFGWTVVVNIQKKSNQSKVSTYSLYLGTYYSGTSEN
jgi:hypothetical protein